MQLGGREVSYKDSLTTIHQASQKAHNVVSRLPIQT
jgi:hypothetical protein